MNRKGVSPLISYAIYAGIGIAAIVIVIQTGLPAINNMRDTTAIQQAIRDLSSMEEQINAIARQGEGAQTTQRLRLSRGQLHIENESIVYTITTGSGIISAGSKRRFGSIILSANAQASLTNATYNGTDCYLLQNQYIEACIKKYGSATTFEQGDISNALLYMEHKEANRTITPSLVTKIDGDVAYSRGQIRTTAVTSGRNLGEAHAALLVKPQDRPKYVIHIQLSSGSDFLNINIE